ncbi:MAG TPA: hypothetical protein PJ988_03270 [Anaerolinea sp.]|nr:hypothetical protein [Anaerolinea sp.]
MSLALPEGHRRVGVHDKFAVGGVQVDGRVESAAPLDHRRVIVRVRDGDGRDAPQGFYVGEGGLVQQADAVPQHVAIGSVHQQGALPDGEARHAADAGQAGLDSADEVVVFGLERLQGGPLLALVANVLAVILTDEAARRGLRRGRVLRAAGLADVFDELRLCLGHGGYSRDTRGYVE